MHPAAVDAGQDIFHLDGRRLRIYVATGIDARPKLLRDLRAAGATTVPSPTDAEIILVQLGTQGAADLPRDFPDKICLDVSWAHTALQRGAMASQIEEWGRYLVSRRPPGHHAGPHLNIPHHIFFGANGNHTDQPQTSSIAVDSALWAVLSQVLSAGQTANQPSNANIPTHPFQQPQAASYSLQASNPLAPQPGVAGQSSALPPDLLGLVGQLLGRPAQDASLPSIQFQAHQWPSHGVSSSTSNTPLPFSYPSTSSHIPSQSVASSDLANAIMNAHRFVDAPSFPVAKHRRTSSAMDIDQVPQPDQDHITDQEMDVMQHAPSSTHMRKPDFVSRSRRVFTDAGGIPLLFYVQPSMKRRHESVETIKKYGGMIAAEVSGSDFVVLAANADHFHETLRSAVASDVPAVKMDFIMGCIKANSLLDPAAFSFDGEMVKRKHGPPILIDLAEMRRISRGEKPQRAPVKKAKTVKKVRVTAAQDKDVGSSESADGPSPSRAVKEGRPLGTRKRSRSTERLTLAPQDHTDDNTVKKGKRRRSSQSTLNINRKTARSPSPVAPNTVVEVRGKYQFTPEEREYWPKYVAHMLKGDPDCTQTKLAQALSRKMPHHSTGSWVTSILMPHRELVANLRKKAFIETRKSAAHDSDDSASEHAVEAETSEQAVPVPRKRLKSTSPPFAHDLDADLEIVTDFLVEGGAEGIDDEEVWKVLQSKHACRTLPNWEEFWEKHGARVSQRVEEIVKSSHSNSEVNIKCEHDD